MRVQRSLTSCLSSGVIGVCEEDLEEVRKIIAKIISKNIRFIFVVRPAAEETTPLASAPSAWAEITWLVRGGRDQLQ